MKKTEYLVFRIQGALIIAGVAAVGVFAIALVAWLGGGARAADAGTYLAAAPLYVGALAVVTNSPIARLFRHVENWFLLIVVTVFVTIPYWIVVFPAQLLALKAGWVMRVDD